ncbi:hypothetical protein IFU04_22355 [Pseudomonas syringae]|nr:hypothetical protein [Pseudomonas syringae]
MTLRITRRFDQHYACPTCSRERLDANTELDDRTWTCQRCHQPVHIKMADPAGNHYLVERHLPRQLTVGDRIVYLHDYNRLGVGELKASSTSTYKEKSWLLVVQDFGHRLVNPDHYVNCIPSTIASA